jgi:cytochrome c oxidase subunit 4
VEINRSIWYDHNIDKPESEGRVMFMSGLLNLGSLVLGLIAWILPVVSLVRYDKIGHRSWAALSVASISACAISLCMQIFYSDHLVRIEDWSALMDTSSAVAMVSTVLLVVTIALNAVAFFRYYGKTSKNQ